MIKVFVYGTLRQGNGNHHLLRDSEFLGNSEITGFKMYSLGGFPAIVRNDDESSIVVGEAYQVDETVFGRLDLLEGYPDLYQRQKVPTDHGTAWVYTMDAGAPFLLESSVISHGDWNQRHSEEV